MAGDEYPKRTRFFAHRYTRLILRMCAAQDISPEAVLLCIHVAHTEDVRHYRSPPMFWNHELCSVLAMSWDRLDRARKKAVGAYWLHYDRGHKAKVARYWVLIPPAFEGMQDKVMGEHPVEISPEYFDPQNTGEYPDEPAEFTRKTRENTRIHPGSIPDEYPEHSTLTLNPKPNPYKKARTSDEPVIQRPEQLVLVTGFDCFWQAYPRKTAKGRARKAWAKAVQGVARDRGGSRHDAGLWLVERAREFSDTPKAKGEFCPYPATWLNDQRYDDDPAVWAESNGTVATHKTGPRPPTRI